MRVLKAALKIYIGYNITRISRETKLNRNTVNRIKDDLRYSGLIQLRNLHSKYKISIRMINWVKKFYKEIDNVGYSIADMIHLYEEEFPGHSIKPSYARYLIKQEGIRNYRSKWQPPRKNDTNSSSDKEMNKAATIAINLMADQKAWPVWIDEWEVHDSKIPVRFWCLYEDIDTIKTLWNEKKGKFYIICAYDWAGLAAAMIFRGNISTVEYSIFINELVKSYDDINNSPDTWQNRMRREGLEDAKIKIYHDNAP